MVFTGNISEARMIHCSLNMELNYFNPRIVSMEPLLEASEVKMELEKKNVVVDIVGLDSSIARNARSSREPSFVNINITHDFVAHIRQSLVNWGSASTFGTAKWEPFYITNKCGVEIEYTLRNQKTKLLPNTIRPLQDSSAQRRSSRLKNLDFLIDLSFGAQYRTIRSISVSHLGCKPFSLRTSDGVLFDTILVHTRLEHGSKIISVESRLSIHNRTNLILSLKLWLRGPKKNVRELLLDSVLPGSAAPIPLGYDLEHISIKVQEDGFSFSNQAVLKKMLDTKRNMVVTSDSKKGSKQICMQMLCGKGNPKRVISLECPIVVENHIPFPVLVSLGIESKGLLWSNQISEDDSEFLTIPLHSADRSALCCKLELNGYRSREWFALPKAKEVGNIKQVRLVQKRGSIRISVMMISCIKEKREIFSSINVCSFWKLRLYVDKIFVNDSGIDFRIGTSKMIISELQGETREHIYENQAKSPTGEWMQPLHYPAFSDREGRQKNKQDYDLPSKDWKWACKWVAEGWRYGRSFDTEHLHGFETPGDTVRVQCWYRIRVPTQKLYSRYSIIGPTNEPLYLQASKSDTSIAILEEHMQGMSVFWIPATSKRKGGGSYGCIVKSEIHHKLPQINVITFHPRFLVYNRCTYCKKIFIRQPKTLQGVATIEFGNKRGVPLNWPSISRNLRIYARCSVGKGETWSPAFNISAVAIYSITVDRLIVRVQVRLLETSTLAVTFLDERTDYPAYQICNETNLIVQYKEKRKNNNQTWSIFPRRACPFAWLGRSASSELFFRVGDQTVTVADEIGEQRLLNPSVKLLPGQQVTFFDVRTRTRRKGALLAVTKGKAVISTEDEESLTIPEDFIYHKHHSKPIYITVNHRGPTRVFRISEFRKQQEEESRPEILRFSAPRIGISFIDETPSELLYFTLMNFRYSVGVTNLKYNQSLSIEAIQVDSHLAAGYPVILWGEAKKARKRIVPVFQMKVVTPRSSHWQVYRIVQIVPQELNLRVDNDIYEKLEDFFSTLLPRQDTNITGPGKPLYFSTFSIYPFTLNLSYRTRQAKNTNRFVGTLKLVLANVNNCPVAMAPYREQNLLTTKSILYERISNFYQGQFFSNTLAFMGSSNAFGNIGGFFRSVGSGINDLIVDTVQNPEDVAETLEGVGSGAYKLVSKTVKGLGTSATGVTETIGSGLSHLTLDQQYQQNRRENREKPATDVFGGVFKGVKSIMGGVGQGLVGVVKKPLEGAKEKGVSGFFQGVGKGVVGLPTKIVVGVVDGASDVVHGISNTMIDSEEHNRMIKKRKTRMFYGTQQRIRPYNSDHALILQIIKESDEISGPVHFEFNFTIFENRSRRKYVIITHEQIIFLDRDLNFVSAIDWKDVFDIQKGNSFTIVIVYQAYDNRSPSRRVQAFLLVDPKDEALTTDISERMFTVFKKTRFRA